MKKKYISIPLNNKFSKEYLQQHFWKCNYSSAGPELKYWVILPKNVKPIKLEPVLIKDADLINIGQYKVIDSGPYLEIAVYYEKIRENITPCDWLIGKLKLSGENIIDKKDREQKEIWYSNVLTQLKVDGDTIISQHTLYRNHDYYFYIRSDCNEKDYKYLAEIIQHINTNFGFN